MSKGKRPLEPVAPADMELLFAYLCPNCERKNPLIAPTQPGIIMCGDCGLQFPIIPVDENTVLYIKLMLDHGRAAADPLFI